MLRQKTLALVALAALFVGAALVVREKGGETERVRIRLGDGEFVLRIADDTLERARGLGGVEVLAPDAGMLFIFPQDDVHAIWMKGMRLPIDILWLSETGVVVDKREDVSPDSFPQIFAPRTPARFVVELPAGSAKRFAVTIGNRMQIFGE